MTNAETNEKAATVAEQGAPKVKKKSLAGGREDGSTKVRVARA